MHILNGTYVKYNDLHIKVKATYKDGKFDGPYTEYYENGNIKVKATYKDDKLDGPYIEYDENGNIKIEKNEGIK